MDIDNDYIEYMLGEIDRQIYLNGNDNIQFEIASCNFINIEVLAFPGRDDLDIEIDYRIYKEDGSCDIITNDIIPYDNKERLADTIKDIYKIAYDYTKDIEEDKDYE